MPDILLTFEDLRAGDVVNGQYAADGVTISSGDANKPPMVFDTDNPTGGDKDLATNNLGNVMIISEDGDSNDPDDNAGGGTFVFNFDDPSKVVNFRALDVEEGGTVRLYNDNGQLVKTVDIPCTSNNGQVTVNLNAEGVARMEVELCGSGAIDNIFYVTPEVALELDGVVEGSAGADVIDVAYDGDPDGDRIDANDEILPGEGPNDDIVDAFGGDDTISSGEGNDEVYAGSGDDTVDGGAGDDIIYGDSNYEGPGAGVSGRESLKWSEAPGFGNNADASGFTQNTGDVDVTFSILRESGRADTGYETDTQFVDGIDTGSDTANSQSSLYSVTNGEDNDADYKLEFSDAVENVQFRVNDIDGDGVVRIKAFDEEGNPIEVLLEAGDRVRLKDTDGVSGNDTGDSRGGYGSDDDARFSMLVTIPGPVSRIIIEHDQNDDDNSGINITDVYFDAPELVDNGEDGDDTLSGGAGDDTIFGEGGDDTLQGDEGDDTLDGGDGDDMLTGGAGADTVSGGAGRDTIIGGNNGDSVDGGTSGDDYDVLDLTGEGPFRVVNETEDGDGDSTSGTVEFLDGNGDVTGSLQFTEIEQIIGDRVNQGPDAEDDEASTDEDVSVDIAVLGNDTDPEDDTLTVISAEAENGTVTINSDGTITYTPDANFNGHDTITYVIEDEAGNTDTATVLVTVSPIKDDPDAVDDSDSTDEDTPITVDLLANDTDVDGDTLSVASATVPAEQGSLVDNGDGTVIFTPTPDFNGTATISYTISDGNGGTDSAIHTIEVTPVNDAPEAEDDTAQTNNLTPVTIPVLDNDTDPDGDMLSVTEATVDVGEVSINPDGTLEYTPVPEFGGETTITYTITDGNGGFDTATVAVNVNNGIVEGTVGDDLIDVNYTGDPEGDMIDAGDAFLPGEGPDDDIVLAGAGDDTVLAGNGDDTVYGEDGDDTLSGQVGDDFLSGGAGDDEIAGGLGDDTIEGGDGDDVIRGNQGEDVIDGGDGDDTIGGGDGNDIIDGGAGDDTIQAGDGDDTVVGGLGEDNLQGNDGDDTIEGNDGDDTISGGAGNDSIDAGDGNDNVMGGSGDDVVDLGAGDDTAQTGSGNDTVSGGDGDDTITTNDGRDTVFGGDGDDIIDTSGHSPLPDLGYPGLFPSDPNPNDDIDFVDGGDGDDIIRTGDDADTILGGAGNDTIDGGLDADIIDGGDGDDRIVGGEGSDIINAGAGDDIVYAGIDPDLGLPDNLDITDEDTGGLSPDLVTNNGQDVVSGGDGNDTIYGADDDDVLSGDAGDDFIDGGLDDDTIDGGTGNDTLIGGQGADTISGGDDRDTIIVDNAEDGIGDVIDGGTGSTAPGDVDDFDTLDLTGSGPLRIVGQTTDADGNSTSGTVEFLDGVGGNVVGSLQFSEIEQIVPCFTPGTSIATPRGEVLVEDLMVGDKVITRDNGIQEIRWIGAKRMDGREFQNNPHLQPVRIQQGSLGNGLPERDMMVSPNHRMLVNNDRVALYFEENEVLVSAKHLVNPSEGIQSIASMGTSYIHFMFDNHEVVLSNGAWTESFQPGDYSLKAIGNAQRNEIFELFPELQGEAGREAYASARLTLKKHEAKLLFK